MKTVRQGLEHVIGQIEKNGIPGYIQALILRSILHALRNDPALDVVITAQE